jgi:two-component system cell cycle response regulator
MTGRILVVDDIEANVRLLQAKLQAEYYHVLTAADGATALAIAAEEKPDLVLLDVMMPHVDGRDVLAKIKAEKESRGIIVLLFSARGEQNDRLVGLELGADDYISKPTHMGSLARKIEYLLEKKPPRPTQA